MMENGTSILFVSHSIDQVQSICQRAIWIEKGRIIKDGSSKVIGDEYKQAYCPQ